MTMDPRDAGSDDDEAGTAILAKDGHESRPLLSGESEQAGSLPFLSPPSPARRTPPLRALLTLMLLTSLATSLYQLPASRVIERRLCLEHYQTHDPSRIRPDGSVDEAACKIDSVQRGLAGLQGVMETAWVVGDFAVTVPLSFAAQQRQGQRGRRRAVLWLNLVPRLALPAWALAVLLCARALPTRAVVAASFLSVLGGDCVLGSLAYSLAAGLTTDPVERATYFGYMGSIAYVVALIGPALSAATMSVALWLPLAMAVGLVLLCVPTIARLPEVEVDVEVEDVLTGPASSSSSSPSRPPSHFRRLAAVVRSHPRNFGLLLVGFLLSSLASADTRLLTQYISKRYAWTFAQAGYLLSCKAVVNFVLLAVVVPRLLRARARARRTVARIPGDASSLDNTRDNLLLARLCLGVSVLGAAAIALSSSIAILVPALLVYALGSVLPVFTLSLLKSPAIVLPETVATSVAASSTTSAAPTDPETQIFAIVMLAKTLGSLIGAPLMAALWVWGITLGGLALGLPYFVSACCYSVAILVLSGIVVA
ncbi:hypothetical protein CMQ_2309 [Grosmannia clavigera kw1407]|uniref:Major facilitator superfamily transporter n=1 Tax=Grosmannia clavigera (strain kw1407 / UAMH 11150) TaxID=655863 RepID=F0XIQ8_GROCL|nr:uncharacterized protein CMQ_2309 [Grosmannia clavigera kw1407]EFX02260.1 hypothetical protein CMQ_2309 [Grosmannia clavigera kw1407]